MRRFIDLRRAVWHLSVMALLLPPAAAGRDTTGPAAAEAADDVAAARALFEKNLDAIRRRDREAYLACYLQAATFARTGPQGARLGYEPLAKETGEEWPDLFEGLDLQLVPIRPGLVYGTYRYRVRYGAREDSGISERFFVKTGSGKTGGGEVTDGWKIAVSTAFPAPPGTPPPPRALVGVTLLDGTGGPAVRDAVVILRGGKIDCAGSRAACPPPKGIDVLHLKGSWITPGIVDAHVHFSQTGWADGRPDALDVRDRYPYEEVQAGLRARPERFLRSYLCSGVTAVFDVGGYSWTWDLRGRGAADPLAPRVAAAGPLLSTWDFWLNLPADRQFIYLGSEESGRAGVRYLASHGTDAVKIWFIPVADRNFDDMAKAVLAAGEEARARKIPLIVHAMGLNEAKVALRAGAGLLVHSVGDVPVDEEFLRLAKENRTIYCPTLTVVDGYRRLREAAVEKKAPAVDDPNGCVDADTLAHVAETARLTVKADDPAADRRRRERFATFGKMAPANLKAVRDAGIAISMGTDAGNPLTLHGPSVYAEMEAMQAAGMTPMEVLVAATRSGALAMRRLEEFGTVEKGKSADLLVVGADPTKDVRNLRRLEYVVKGGVVRAQAELRAVAPAPR
ncbi:MAG: amidohydrolase family protein [Acidobacteria bacterium]|nr:amidohydrolase family protein [Acidobacteriota bacterium]